MTRRARTWSAAVAIDHHAPSGSLNGPRKATSTASPPTSDANRIAVPLPIVGQDSIRNVAINLRSALAWSHGTLGRSLAKISSQAIKINAAEQNVKTRPCRDSELRHAEGDQHATATQVNPAAKRRAVLVNSLSKAIAQRRRKQQREPAIQTSRRKRADPTRSGSAIRCSATGDNEERHKPDRHELLAGQQDVFTAVRRIGSSPTRRA